VLALGCNGRPCTCPVIGWILPVIIVFFLLITRFQNFLPGLLYGKGYAWDRLTYAVYVPGEGAFGVPLGVASTIVIVFLIFAQLMQKAGLGEWFSRLALVLAGWTRGGAAKTAVLASAFSAPSRDPLRLTPPPPGHLPSPL
jgi:TRAP-type uncharacterized transport system fused permease subunit